MLEGAAMQNLPGGATWLQSLVLLTASEAWSMCSLACLFCLRSGGQALRSSSHPGSRLQTSLLHAVSIAPWFEAADLRKVNFGGLTTGSGRGLLQLVSAKTFTSRFYSSAAVFLLHRGPPSSDRAHPHRVPLTSFALRALGVTQSSRG